MVQIVKFLFSNVADRPTVYKTGFAVLKIKNCHFLTPLPPTFAYVIYGWPLDLEDDEQTSSTPSKQPNLLSKPQKQEPKTNTSPATKKAAMKAVAALLQAEPEPELILPEQVIMPFKAQELIGKS